MAPTYVERLEDFRKLTKVCLILPLAGLVGLAGVLGGVNVVQGAPEILSIVAPFVTGSIGFGLGATFGEGLSFLACKFYR